MSIPGSELGRRGERRRVSDDGLVILGRVGGSVVDALWRVEGVVAVGVLVDLPSVAMDQLMTAPAGRHQVLDAGWATSGERFDVVGLADREVRAAVKAPAPFCVEDASLGGVGVRRAVVFQIALPQRSNTAPVIAALQVNSSSTDLGSRDPSGRSAISSAVSSST